MTEVRTIAVIGAGDMGHGVAELAALRGPTRLVGMHFFNPVMLMDLVEIVPSPATSPATLATAQEVAKHLGKTMVTLREDTPGFVTSRLIGAWIDAAALCADAKLA